LRKVDYCQGNARVLRAVFSDLSPSAALLLCRTGRWSSAEDGGQYHSATTAQVNCCPPMTTGTPIMDSSEPIVYRTGTLSSGTANRNAHHADLFNELLHRKHNYRHGQWLSWKSLPHSKNTMVRVSFWGSMFGVRLQDLALCGSAEIAGLDIAGLDIDGRLRRGGHSRTGH